MQSQPSAAPTAPPAPVAQPSALTQARAVYPGASPADMYSAMRAQRLELRDQLEGLEDRREELRSELHEAQMQRSPESVLLGMQQRIAELDARIAGVDRQLAAAEVAVAEAAAVPGAVVEPVRQGPPEEVFVLGGMFMVLFLFPLTIAYARRIWRRSAAVAMSIPAELQQRLSRIEQAVDAVAVEVERIGESQRFMTRVFTDQEGQRAIGEGAAQPLPIRAGEREPAHGG